LAMELRITADPDDGQVLSVYLEIAPGRVHRTVEVVEGECYVDEDASGRPLGVEMLCADRLQVLADDVADRYHLPAISQAFANMKAAFAA